MPTSKDLKVLLVDDRMRMRQLTRFGLAQLGIVQVEDAILSLEEKPVHLVMCDHQAGANNFIVKPFSSAVLRDKLEAVVGKLD